MKKLITLSLIVATVGIMSNCSPKTAKKVAKTESKTASKEESPTSNPPNNGASSENVVKLAQGDRTDDEQIKMLSQVSSARLDNGKQLYETTCNKCHELYSPSKRNAAGWVDIMKSMGPKAKLEQGPYLMISAYLIKNAKG